MIPRPPIVRAWTEGPKGMSESEVNPKRPKPRAIQRYELYKTQSNATRRTRLTYQRASRTVCRMHAANAIPAAIQDVGVRNWLTRNAHADRCEPTSAHTRERGCVLAFSLSVKNGISLPPINTIMRIVVSSP